MSWQAATTGTAPTGYKVRVNPDCGKAKTKTVGADKLSVTFGKVKQCITYKVWVRAQHSAGDSDKLKTEWQRPQHSEADDETEECGAGCRARYGIAITYWHHLDAEGNKGAISYVAAIEREEFCYGDEQNECDPPRYWRKIRYERAIPQFKNADFPNGIYYAEDAWFYADDPPELRCATFSGIGRVTYTLVEGNLDPQIEDCEPPCPPGTSNRLGKTLGCYQHNWRS